MTLSRRNAALVSAACVVAAAQSSAQTLPDSLPPIRTLSTPQETSVLTFTRSVSVRVLSDGRVIVHDGSGRRVLLLETDLANGVTIYDRNSPAPLTYPRTPQVMYAAPGDTTYLTDLPARGFRVISPLGLVDRWQPFANPADGPVLVSRNAGTIIAPGLRMIFAHPVQAAPRGGWPSAQGGHDSLTLTRVNLATRRRDSLGFVAMQQSSVTRPVEGDASTPPPRTMTIPVFDVGDAIAMTSSGALAIIRVADFHVDWLEPDGRWRRSSPVRWTWRKLSPAEKQDIRARTESRLGNVTPVAQIGTEPAQVTTKAADVPDYEPPFVPMSAIPDLEGRVWLQLGSRTLYQANGPPVYAIIDSTGQIVGRVGLPPGRVLAGFGPAGTLYAIDQSSRDATIERYVLPPK